LFPVIFALVSAVGAWMAWRRNPLYSTRSTLRSGIYILLSIAAIIGLMVGTVNLVIDRSPLVAGVALGTVIIFGALALIFIISSVSTPKQAKLITALPPTAKVVHIHRQKVYEWAKVLAITLVIVGVLAIVLPGNSRYVAYAFGSVALALGVIMLPVGYYNALKFDRSLTALMYDPWVHWQYSPADWKAWVDVQVARAKATPAKFIWKRDWRKFVWPFSFIALGVYDFSPGSWLMKTLYIVGCLGMILLIVAAGTRDSTHAPETLRATLLKVAPDAYFGRDGLFCNGAYTTWVGLSVYLTSASVDQNPPRSLLFRFAEVVPNPYEGTKTLHIDQSVLIPPDAEHDIVRLQQELTTRCPKAQIVLS
jgi:hypothetical protein